jgi:hypothetical protein
MILLLELPACFDFVQDLVRSGEITTIFGCDGGKWFVLMWSLGRGGGDRTRPLICKSRELMALQPPTKSNC